MRILIAGYGFVGHAFDKAVNMTNEITISDPAKGYLINHNDLVQPQAIVICVSTPQGSHGGCHMDNVYEVIEQSPDVPILIKSTISLEGWEMLKHVFPNKSICFSPEFLRAETADEDFKNMDYTIIAGDPKDTEFWNNWFKQQVCWVDLEIYNCPVPEAITLKYAENSYLALKVSFFNQLYDFCQVTNQDFETMRKLLCLDKRIGNSHSMVTEERGWGGHCFPKDTSAFLKTAEKYSYDLNILRTAVDYNKKIRKTIDNQ
jgi:UDPglucose 6-dehydrogenase|tara:strand:+ start:554 stop:1333 length:780 start_codon:yes stop_codon:yes gene_type:complete